MWTQIVGKIRMTLTPLINHYWNATLYVSARGLTTSAIPYPRGVFEIEFDFIGHKLVIQTSEGEVRTLGAGAAHGGRLLRRSDEHARGAQDRRADSRRIPMKLRIRFLSPRIARTNPTIANPVERFRRLLISVDKVLKNFRARFIGKCSPVHFFWGSFDLAVTRFSGASLAPRSDARFKK